MSPSRAPVRDQRDAQPRLTSSATTTSPPTPPASPSPRSTRLGDAEPPARPTAPPTRADRHALAASCAADGVTATLQPHGRRDGAGSPIRSARRSPGRRRSPTTTSPPTPPTSPSPRRRPRSRPNAASKTYGAADPALTGTLTGFLAADGVTATYSRTAGETVAGALHHQRHAQRRPACSATTTSPPTPPASPSPRQTASVTPDAAEQDLRRRRPVAHRHPLWLPRRRRRDGDATAAPPARRSPAPYTISATLARPACSATTTSRTTPPASRSTSTPR